MGTSEGGQGQGGAAEVQQRGALREVGSGSGPHRQGCLSGSGWGRWSPILPACIFSPPHPLPGDSEMLPPSPVRPQAPGDSLSGRGSRPPLLPSGFSCPSSLGCGFRWVLGSVVPWHPSWKLDSRLWILGLEWRWPGVISAVACAPTVFPARVRCLETLNPGLLWLLPVLSALTAPLNSLSLCFSLLSLVPRSWLWCLSQRLQSQ